MSGSPTIIELLVERLRATAEGYNTDSEEAPVAILWTDPDGAWRPVVAQLQPLMPELLVLGAYAPEKRMGPVIWLKCAFAGTLKDVSMPAGVRPILYLPGVARHQLRAADQCPWELQPLVELLYRGTVWTHPNGRDWSLEAFFQSDEGLGLDMANDERTRESLRSAIGVLAKTPLDRLRKAGRLEAHDFDEIVVGDTPRDILTWLSNPTASRAEWGEARWQAFRSRCRDRFEFDPGKDDPLLAAERLGKRESESWQQLWNRFCESPALYGGVKEALDRAQPHELVADKPESWPAENEKLETELRHSLAGLDQLAPHDARHAIFNLDKDHGHRRAWVWAKTGDAPLACSLAVLQELANATRTIPNFDSPTQSVAWYVELGWKADDAALRALRTLRRPKDEGALHAAIRAVYGPWLEELARQFQGLVDKHGYTTPAGETAAEGECLLFVDGLRFDAGQHLAAGLERLNLRVGRSHRLAGLPTVTPSAKPAVAPIAWACSGAKLPPDFRPNAGEAGELTHVVFGKLLDAAGYQRLRAGESMAPASDSAKGWLETGRIDTRGHELGAELAGQIRSELDRVVALVEGLLAAGWKRVKIITDHGWLLMPGGLAKHDLPAFLVESRWSRCAVIKGASTPQVQTVPWRWNPGEHVAVAPGAKVFRKGEAYAHGGLTLQECVTPVLRVSADGGSAGTTRIVALRWKGLRCSVELSGPATGLSAHVEIASTRSRVASKDVEPDGHVSLLVGDDSHLGKPATLLITESSGAVIAKGDTRVGG
jgi:hypothetical protein